MIRLRPGLVLGVLLACNAILMIGFLITKNGAVSSPALVRFFNLPAEASVPPWWNGSLLLVAGLLAGLRAMDLKQNHVRSHWKVYLIAAAGFTLLSADEVAQIHETISGTMHRRMADKTGEWGAQTTAWDLVTAVLYIGGGLVAALVVWRDVLALLRERAGRAAMIVGGVVLVGGAVVVDHLGLNLPLGFHSVLEDGMEMTGSAILVYAMLVKLGSVTLRVAPDGKRLDDASSDGRADRSARSPSGTAGHLSGVAPNP